VPTPVVAAGRIPLIAPQQNAVAPQPATAGATTSVAPAAAGTTIGARGLLDADTSDDLLIDVPDESEGAHGGGELSAAITSLPGDVQMIGYRVMWALAGFISLGAAAISYYLRDTEDEAETETRTAAPAAAGPPPRRPVPVGAVGRS
jgi:hypothetical protein